MSYYLSCLEFAVGAAAVALVSSLNTRRLSDALSALPVERRQLASSDSDRARSERMADRLHGGSKLGRGVLRAPSVTDLQHTVPRGAALPPGASPEVRF